MSTGKTAHQQGLTRLVGFYAQTESLGEGGTQTIDLELLAVRQAAVTPQVSQRDIQGRRVEFQTRVDLTLRYDAAVLQAQVLRIDEHDFTIKTITHDRRAGWLSIIAESD